MNRRAIPGLELAGEIASFGWEAIRRTPRASRFGAEVLRQMGLLASGSAMIIIVACLLVGQSCGLESAYVARALSTPAFAAGGAFGRPRL